MPMLPVTNSPARAHHELQDHGASSKTPPRIPQCTVVKNCSSGQLPVSLTFLSADGGCPLLFPLSIFLAWHRASCQTPDGLATKTRARHLAVARIKQGSGQGFIYPSRQIQGRTTSAESEKKKNTMVVMEAIACSGFAEEFVWLELGTRFVGYGVRWGHPRDACGLLRWRRC
jgi:hypothetical protein